MDIRIVIGGSRKFEDYGTFCQYVDSVLAEFTENYQITIISGHCYGTDMLGERYANEKGYKLEIYPPNWKLYKRGAGVIRNKIMVETADLVIAFLGNSNGTKNLIKTATAKGLPIYIYNI